VPSGSDVDASKIYGVSLHSLDNLPRNVEDQWSISAGASKKPGAAYQSPSYSNYLAKTASNRKVELIVVSSKYDDHALGFAPMQHTNVLLPWSSRARAIGGIKLSSIDLLGSEPNIPETFQVYDDVFSLLMKEARNIRVINLEMVPANSFTWRYVSTSKAVLRRYFVYVLHGFRECHLIKIPISLEIYNATLTRKKRYNLGRQKRLLEAHLGNNVTLTAIDSVADLDNLFLAIKALNVPKMHESTLSRSEFTCACENGLTLCYVLKCETRVLGLAIGTKSKCVYNIHRFYYDKSLKNYSIGTTLWQEILRDLIARGSFCKVDMGYGAPTYNYRSMNDIEMRANVLLVRRSYSNYALFAFYSSYRSLIFRLKQSLKWLSKLHYQLDRHSSQPSSKPAPSHR
jgi:hypothetical protein